MFKTLGVQSLKINIPKEFLNRKFRILVKEYWEGEVLSVDSGFLSDEFIEGSDLLTVIMYKENDSTERVRFIYPPIFASFGPYHLKFDRIRYGWASLISENSGTDLKNDIPFLTFTYEPTPKENPNYSVFCILPEMANQVDKWYSVLSVKHSYVFIFHFESKE